MLTDEQLRGFRDDGFLLVPGVLSQEQVAALRELLEERFGRPVAERGHGDVEGFAFDLFSREPRLRWLLFHEPTLSILRDLLGRRFVALRETVAQREQFGHWHKDTTSQERAGHRFHYEPDFLMVEVGYYLQDETAEHGGGLEVGPGSHRDEPDAYARRGFLERARGRVAGGPRPPSPVRRLPSRAGDLVVFHFRITHRATRGSSPSRPPGREKIALFQACSADNAHVDAYQEFIASRPAYRYLEGFAWPDDLRVEAERHGVKLG